MYAVIEKGRVVQYVVGFKPEGTNVIEVPQRVAENRIAFEYKDGEFVKRPEPEQREPEKIAEEKIPELEQLIADLAELVLFGGDL